MRWNLVFDTFLPDWPNTFFVETDFHKLSTKSTVVISNFGGGSLPCTSILGVSASANGKPLFTTIFTADWSILDSSFKILSNVARPSFSHPNLVPRRPARRQNFAWKNSNGALIDTRTREVAPTNYLFLMMLIVNKCNWHCQDAIKFYDKLSNKHLDVTNECWAQTLLNNILTKAWFPFKRPDRTKQCRSDPGDLTTIKSDPERIFTSIRHKACSTRLIDFHDATIKSFNTSRRSGKIDLERHGKIEVFFLNKYFFIGINLSIQCYIMC